MADSGITLGTDALKAIGTGVAFIAGVVTWIFKRQVARIDNLEEKQANSISKDDLTAAMDGMRRDISSGFDRMADELRHQSSRIDGLYQRRRDE